MADWSKLTPREIIDAMAADTTVNRMRRAFVNEMGRLQQAHEQRDAPNPVDARRMEFEAAERLLATATVPT